MRIIRQWIDRLSVKKKLVLYGYLTIAPVLMVICMILTANNYYKVRDERLENDLVSTHTLAESWGVLQTDIKDFSTYICINHDIYELLTTAHPEIKNENARLWMDEAPMDIVQDMIALKGHIKTLAIYPENGVRPYLRGMDGSVNLPDIEALRQTQIYREAFISDNGMVWKSVPKGSSEIYEVNRSDKLVFFREIRDLAQKETLGHIVIGVSEEYFTNLAENALKDDEKILILDRNGGVLCSAGQIDQELYEYLKSEDFVKTAYKERPEHFSYGENEVICTQLDKNSGIICKIVPKYSLRTQIWDAAYMPLMLLLGMMIALLPLLVIISNIVTKPLRKLSEAITKVSAGDFEQQVEITTQDEIGEVAHCFNMMVCSIRELIEQNYVITLQEKESELAALQAQINPHFLYNTLDSLYWQAMEMESEELAESILALSQLFRLVLGQGKREVTVSHEVELVSRYLQIQKMRFTKRLDYSVTVDPGITKAKIPKLILQPFVENAIVHGFENMNVPCRLTVSGQLIDGSIRFQICDTGVGMRQDQIDEIWEEEPDQYRKQRIGRYAIKNIRERLQRRYQDRFSLDIQSEVGKGTTVTLVVPYEEDV